MAHSPRLTRRFPAAMTEAGYRRLRKAAGEHGLSEGQMLSFVFENLEALMDEETWMHRLRQFKQNLPEGGRGS